MLQNALLDVDFRATVTHFVNISVFLLFFENWGESSIACAEYSASKVVMFVELIDFIDLINFMDLMN